MTKIIDNENIKPIMQYKKTFKIHQKYSNTSTSCIRCILPNKEIAQPTSKTLPLSISTIKDCQMHWISVSVFLQ